MTDINPPVRTRVRPTSVEVVVQTPRARTRPVLTPRPETEVAVSSPIVVRARTRPAPDPTTNPWYVPPEARQLGQMQRTHNGYLPSGSDLPDPRFKPLLIVMNPLWRKNLPEYIGMRFEEAIKLKAEDCAKLEPQTAAIYYITEFGLRHKLGCMALADGVYDALRERLLLALHAKDKDGKPVLHAVSRGMMTQTEDGDLLIDFNKNSGPFYCDSLIGIEAHFPNKLKSMHRVAA